MEEKDRKDFEEIKSIISKVEVKCVDPNKITRSDKWDRIVSHNVFGLIIFAVIMFLVFTISQTLLGPIISDLLVYVMTLIAQWVQTMLVTLNVSPFLTGLLLEGMIGGLSSVLSFLPLIMILFFLLQLLEDSGYMARVALVMDRYFKKIGLVGKSIIPMYVGTACSVPAVMSARTIKNKKQRIMTILLTPFVPCGAKLPIIAFLVSVFFTGNSFFTAIVYGLSILIIFFAGYVLKSLIGADFSNQEETYLIVELPAYKVPSIKLAFTVMLDRGWAFIKKAGTVILLMNLILWIIINYNFSFQSVTPNESILGLIAQPLTWIMIPLGLGMWGLVAATISGFVAKEEVIGALAIIFAFGINEHFEVLGIEATRQILMTLGGLTTISAFSFMAFNLFSPPCFAAISAMKIELGSSKLTIFAVALQLVIGYFVSMVIYQFGTLIFMGQLGDGFIASIIIFSFLIGGFFYLKNLAKNGKGLSKWVI
jgi:ferrous iron transport protein B